MRSLSEKEIQIAIDVLLAKHDLCFFSKDSTDKYPPEDCDIFCVYHSSEWFKGSTYRIEQFLEDFLFWFVGNMTTTYRGVYLEAAGILLDNSNIFNDIFNCNLQKLKYKKFKNALSVKKKRKKKKQ